MKRIRLLNRIAGVGIEEFDKAEYRVGADVEDPDGILVRSTDMQEMAFGPALKAIARAGAGVNNIPLRRCAQAGVVVFNTPGANANSVKELTLCALLLSCRDIAGGIEWVKSLPEEGDLMKAVEAGKGAFAGVELAGRTLGVVGLGAIGGQVANIAQHLGMSVIGCDPYLSVDAAWRLSRNVLKAADFDDLYRRSDFITLHVPSSADTRGMISAKSIARMKRGVRIVNLARADLVVNADLAEALRDGRVARYVTDFPSRELLGVRGVVALPHLGASTEEAEDNCAVMAARELREFLENGNITNSVNFPDASMPHLGDARVCVMHYNIPHMLARFSSILSNENINIENMLNRSRDDMAYTIIEIRGQVPEDVVTAIRDAEGVLRVNQY